MIHIRRRNPYIITMEVLNQVNVCCLLVSTMIPEVNETQTKAKFKYCAISEHLTGTRCWTGDYPLNNFVNSSEIRSGLDIFCDKRSPKRKSSMCETNKERAIEEGLADLASANVDYKILCNIIH